MKTPLALLGLTIGICVCMTMTCPLGFAFGRWSTSLTLEERGQPPSHAPETSTSTACVAESTVTCPSATSTALPTVTVIASPTVPSGASIECTCAYVTSVVDGDTIVIDSGETVRYIGIDTPEVDECYGTEATEMNRQLVEGKTVVLISDVEDRGRYDRLLRYVIADGRFVNAELVRLGYAKAQSYGDNVMFQQVLTVFEFYAQESGAGLWSACTEE